MLLCTEKDRLVIVFNVGWTKQWQRGTAIKIPGTELSASKIASLLLENGAEPVPYSVRFFLRFFRRLSQRKDALLHCIETGIWIRILAQDMNGIRIDQCRLIDLYNRVYGV